jgi:hypothetical protein
MAAINEGRVNRNVVHQVRQQQVKREERACEEEVVDRVQFDIAHGGEDEHYEKEQQQRDRCEIADPAGERAGLQLLGHGHAYLKSGDEVEIAPRQAQPRGVSCFSVGERASGGKSI